MARDASPLRYPGGKSCLYDLVAIILRKNNLQRGDYVEPYAGGCGLALSLLYGGHVGDIHINDVDVAIWSFWDSVLNRTEDFINLVQTIPVTVDEWHKQKKIFASGNTKNSLKLGFATFFLNRTNRSGIIKDAGMIGGLSQKGEYKLDCRFNREELSRRIERVAKYRKRIHLTNLDAVPFMCKMQTELPKNAFFCIDPPYFNKGSSLYTSFYDPFEHKKVANMVLKLKQPWIVTYDDADDIKILYKKRRQFIFDIKYSLQAKRVGSELLVASKDLWLPEEIEDRKASFAA